MFYIVFASAILTLCAHGLAAQTSSVYSSLERTQCRTIKTTGAGDYEGRCPNMDAYYLTVLEGDLRQNVVVVAPAGTKHSLDLWDVIGGGFSHVGPRAEWRVTTENGKRVPVALIFRYHVSEDADHPDKKTSYLVVAKITDNEICVTDKISPSPNANEAARTAADSASTKPCLKETVINP